MLGQTLAEAAFPPHEAASAERSRKIYKIAKIGLSLNKPRAILVKKAII
jgi:hypothetical protein